MRIVALTDSCYECSGPVSILMVPDDMDLVAERSQYDKWYHDEYLNPESKTGKEYKSFSHWLCGRGASVDTGCIEWVDEVELRWKAPRLWTYERPKSDFEMMMEEHWRESILNYKVIDWSGLSHAKIVEWELK